eukprot:gb/GECG01015514.1/.p1 GENE.gb/GECG01015514.1/~~gb/GECG01015514.1/.p1  ORF type:complete len:787 (+),score=92.92 gb/GECG01015514.1/:1-2361(+)
MVTHQGNLEQDSITQRGEYLSNLIAEKCRRGHSEDAFEPKEVAEMVEEYGLKPLVEFLHKRRSQQHESNDCDVQQPLLSRRVFGALYTAVTKCTQKEAGAEHLYNTLQRFTRTFLNEWLLPKIQDLEGDIFLQRFTEIWQDFLVLEAWTSKLFRHLNCENTVELRSTTAESLVLFKSTVFDPMSSQLRKALLSMIQNRRHGMIVDKTLIRENIMVFVSMDLDQFLDAKNLRSTVASVFHSSDASLETYVKEFETSFINVSKDYYLEQAQELFDDQNLSAYLQTVENFFSEEKELARTCLHPATEVKLKEALIDALLRPRYASIIENRQVGLSGLLDEGSRADLQRMLSLFSSFSEGNDCLCREFSKHLEEKICDLHSMADARPSSQSRNLNLIDSIAQLYRHYKLIIDDMLEGSTEYLDILRRTISRLFASSRKAERYSVLIARYLNSIVKNNDIVENNWKLDMILELLRLLNHQDYFLQEYENLLAERFLHFGRSRADLERSVISRLKLEMGSLATRRMEGMYRDITETSTSVTASFQQQYPQAENYFEPTVLSTSHWPFSWNVAHVSPPTEFSQIADAFIDFYSCHWDRMRRLRWLWPRGKAQLYGFFNKESPKLLHTSLLQAFVLLLFNKRSTWSLEGISRAIDFPEHVTSQVMHSLTVRAKKRISNNGEIIKRDGTNYIFHDQFKNPRKILKLPIPIIRDEGTAKHEDKVKENRRFEIDAVIVRLMKARQKVSHQELIAEVQHQIRRFPAEPKVIKHRIEDLINRDYLARDEDDSQFYVYVS